MKLALHATSTSFVALLAATAGICITATPATAQAADPSQTAAPGSNSGSPDATVEPPAEQQARAQPAPDPDAMPDIVVTGSLIRGKAPVGSSLIEVDRSAITNSGALTVSDALKDVPQITALGVDESHRGVQGGAQNIFYNNQINIRSLGPQATLTLINGHRAPSTGTSGFGIDPSTIPSIALERVEIVADGASAIYGSDAIAGVANIITRKNFKGLEVSARLGAADSFNENQQGIIAGFQSDRAGIVLAAEHSYHSRLEGRDRDYFRYDLRRFGGSDFRTHQCNPGTISVGGETYAIPAGGVTPATAGLLVPGTANLCDTYNTRSILPEQERYTLYGAGHVDLSPGLSLFAEGYYYHRQFNLAAPNTTPAQTLTVPSSNAYFVLPPGVPADTRSVQVAYYVPGVGPQFRHDGKIDSWQGTAGIDADLPGGWHGTLQGSYGRDHSMASYPQANAAAVAAALASSDPATALDPFAAGMGPNNQTVLDSLFSQNFIAEGITKQTLAEIKFDGPLFALPGGDIRVAVGAGYEHDELYSNARSINPDTGVRNAPINPSHNIKSVFGELLVPIVSDSNAAPLLQSLELDAAVRYEDYSDVGSTTNPKIGISWSPAKGVKLRGSYGTSFRAPTLSDIINPNPRLYVEDYVDPKSPTGRSNVLSWIDNNPDLRPETATTYSLGLDLAPPAWRGFRASVNYFNIDYENQITSFLNVPTVLQQEDIYSSVIIRDPSQAFLDSLLSRLPVTGVLPGHIAAVIDSRSLNLGTVKTAGFDGTISYTLETGAGQFRASLEGIYFTRYDAAITPTAPAVDRLDELNFPVHYNFRTRLGWHKDGATAIFTFAYTPPYDNPAVTPVQRVHSNFVVDAHLAYDLGSSGVLSNASVALDVSNLFDRDPPFVNQLGGYDPNLASAMGRKILFTLGWRL